MSKAPIERRKAQRNAWCRGCDEKIEAGDEMITTYSWRNRGQYIHFCISCGTEIGELCQWDAQS